MSKASAIGKTIATLAVIGGVGFGGWYYYKHYGNETAVGTDKVYVQKVSNVNTVTGSDLFANSFSGVIVAQKSVDVKYDTTKTVDEILVADGDTVKKGDKLLTYDTEQIQLDIDTAKLEVEKLENNIETNKQQISQYEEEKKKASEDAAVSYTNQILQLESDNARSEYDIKAKNVEINKLETSLKNAYVTAPVDGTVKDLKDPSSSGLDSGGGFFGGYGGESEDVIMKLSADGQFLVKGVFNEQNQNSIFKGAPVILRSRVDDTSVNGTVSEIDTSPQQSSDDMYDSFGGSDEQSTSSKYAFYVEPESLDGFMLGQHVLIDTDNGSTITKTGIWLYKDFVLADGEKSYVWAKKGDKELIEKRYVEIGQTDDEYGDVEITDGLSTDDYIAYPADYIKEGLATTTNSSDKDIPENELGGMDDGFADDGGFIDDGLGEDGGDFFVNDDGSYAMTDENGNNVAYSEDGSVVITSPDGGVVEMDAEGNFLRGSINEETGEYVFDYEGGEAAEEEGGDADADAAPAEEGAESAEKAEESEAADLTYEELYGMSEEEFKSMSPEELDKFLEDFYNK